MAKKTRKKSRSKPRAKKRTKSSKKRTAKKAPATRRKAKKTAKGSTILSAEAFLRSVRSSRVKCWSGNQRVTVRRKRS